MQDSKQKTELPKGEKYQGSDTEIPNPCDDILKKMKGCVIPVSINAAQVKPDCDNPQYMEINAISTFIKDSRIDFNCYKKAMDKILNHVHRGGSQYGNSKGFKLQDLCKDIAKDDVSGIEKEQETIKNLTEKAENIFGGGPLFQNSKAYNILKYATQRYVYAHFGVDKGDIVIMPDKDVLPYVELVESNLGDICCKCDIEFHPMFAELIWNYWMEEGMMVNTVNAISKRFQNKRSDTGLDPLVNMAIDPLRPINNLIWGYIQDSINRLTMRRRAFEYDSQYGLPLFAAGGGKLNTADSRTYFIQAFHNLLYKCSLFYKEADNLMKVPDGYPVLNALREVHLILSEGAGNQFGDLPVTARAEMLLEQYMLSRHEIREFLGGRIMVPYEESWMDRVDSMKTLQGWPGASISYFRDLAVYGEQIILSIRWISWSQIKNRDFAREWAIIFREDIQRYIHCYQAVTGVDLSATEVAGTPDLKAVAPASLMGRKARLGIRR